MKKLLLACMLLAMGAPSFAQWTGTTNIYNTYSAGNVGIGVISPSAKLTVGGSTNANPNSSGSEVDFAGLNLTFREESVSNGSFNLGVIKMVQPNGFFIDGAHMTFGISSGGVLTERMRIENHGNVGLSTIPIVHAGYTSLSINNAANGGYLDFLQAGVRQGYLTGDASGLSLFSGTGTGLHLWANNAEKLTILSNGNVGVNVNTPVATMHVNGTLITGAGAANLDPAYTTGNISFLGNYSGEMLMGWNRVKEGESDFISNRGPATGNGGFAFFDYSNTGGTTTELMRVRSTGEVLIGVLPADFLQTQSIGSNKLAVGGGIITEAVTVKLQSAGWPDYVFKPAYSLLALSKVKAYIDANHHLPEMPSEGDIKKDGQNLGEMNRLLLKKVEELTLYLIEKDKQFSKQQDQMNKQQEQINKQEEQILLLKQLRGMKPNSNSN